MIDIIKLRKVYSALNRIQHGKDPFKDENLTLEALQTEDIKQVFADAAEVMTVYGKLMNLITESTSFKIVQASKKQPFTVSMEQAAAIEALPTLTNISTLVKYINECLQDEEMCKLTTTGLGTWLIDEGYLELPAEGKNKISTSKGNDLGISTEERTSPGGETYYINYYTPAAQRFILDKLPEIAEFTKRSKEVM